GSGLMGSGIAEVLARSGLDVVVRDISDEAVAAGRGRIEKSFAKGVERGKL
ncbi:3-hydroxybutyryl-CoA dehydrogenase, partial [Brevibacterium paucivorans]